MKHIGWLLGGMLMLLLLTACGSSSSTEDDVIVNPPEKPQEKPVLKIYLFAPDSPIVTRASNGYVDASEAEKQIYSIDVWVFEHDSPDEMVSYIHLDELSFTGQREISMEISDDFANLPKKPNVDIYVVTNKESCGLTDALNENTTLAQLKEMCIGSEFFGTSPLVSTVPDKGLPMSGLLENQIISGIPPVYTAKANFVKLVRSVSKVRFIFSKSSSNPPTVSNLSIQLNANMLPKEEYVFLEGVYPIYNCHVKTGENAYVETATTLVSGVGIDDIYGCGNPASYAYTTQTGQEYENLINSGLVDPEGDELPDLSQVGLFYLRESDKQLTGTINYTLGTGNDAVNKSVPFSMGAAGDFTRNHTWIVYGYFLGSGDLKLNAVSIKDWTSGSENPIIYNW